MCPFNCTWLTDSYNPVTVSRKDKKKKKHLSGHTALIISSNAIKCSQTVDISLGCKMKDEHGCSSTYAKREGNEQCSNDDFNQK